MKISDRFSVFIVFEVQILGIYVQERVPWHLAREPGEGEGVKLFKAFNQEFNITPAVSRSQYYWQ